MFYKHKGNNIKYTFINQKIKNIYSDKTQNFISAQYYQLHVLFKTELIYLTQKTSFRSVLFYMVLMYIIQD